MRVYIKVKIYIISLLIDIHYREKGESASIHSFHRKDFLQEIDYRLVLNMSEPCKLNSYASKPLIYRLLAYCNTKSIHMNVSEMTIRTNC